MLLVSQKEVGLNSLSFPPNSINYMNPVCLLSKAVRGWLINCGSKRPIDTTKYFQPASILKIPSQNLYDPSFSHCQLTPKHSILSQILLSPAGLTQQVTLLPGSPSMYVLSISTLTHAWQGFTAIRLIKSTLSHNSMAPHVDSSDTRC